MSNNTQLQQLINDNIPTLEKYADFQDFVNSLVISRPIKESFLSYTESRMIYHKESLFKSIRALEKGFITVSLSFFKKHFEEIDDLVTDWFDTEFDYEIGTKNDKDEMLGRLVSLIEDLDSLIKTTDSPDDRLLNARDFAIKKQSEIASVLSSFEEAEDFLLKCKSYLEECCDYIDDLIMKASKILENSELPQEEEKTETQDDDRITKLTSKLVAQLLSNDDFKNLMLELSK